MAAHRIAESDAKEPAHQEVGETAGAGPLFRQAGRRAAAKIAARHHEIATAAAQAIEHGDEQTLVVLQIGVHDRDIARLACQHAFEAGAGEAAAADAAHAADAAVGLAERARDGRGAVRRVIVNEQHLPFAAGQHMREPLDQNRDVGALVVGRHHDAEFRRRPRLGNRRAGRRRGRSYG